MYGLEPNINQTTAIIADRHWIGATVIDIEVLIVIFLFVCTVVFFNLDSIASELEEIVDKLIQNDESEI